MECKGTSSNVIRPVPHTPISLCSIFEVSHRRAGDDIPHLFPCFVFLVGIQMSVKIGRVHF